MQRGSKVLYWERTPCSEASVNGSLETPFCSTEGPVSILLLLTCNQIHEEPKMERDYGRVRVSGEDRMTGKYRALVLLGLLMVPSTWNSVVAAQSRLSEQVIVATLAGTLEGLRGTSDARISGVVAFDPRIVRAPLDQAPRNWPDSVSPSWVGDVRDSTLTRDVALTMLRGADLASGNGRVRWVPCGSGFAAQRCGLANFPAVVAVSEPWIEGDVAQIIVYVRYRSTIEVHPWAYFANLTRLERADGRWRVTRWRNLAGT